MSQPQDMPVEASDEVTELITVTEIAKTLFARRSVLNDDIAEGVKAKKAIQARINQSRAELKDVNRLLSATKPRTRTSKKGAS